MNRESVRVHIARFLAGSLCLSAPLPQGTGQPQTPASQAAPPPNLEAARLTMGKWIETQQILSRERKDWQRDQEILVSRIDLIRKELGTLAEKIKQAEGSVADAHKKRSELEAENEQLKAALAQLATAVGGMEVEVRRLFRSSPEPIQTALQPLHQRIPEDPAKTRASVAERFQNVLGILNALNKANNELTVSFEVHTLADGKPAEVRVLYVGLVQAYYVSARGEAGIGRPGPDGWQWQAVRQIGPDVANALEILQGKQSPAFVSLPVRLP